MFRRPPSVEDFAISITADNTTCRFSTNIEKLTREIYGSHSPIRNAKLLDALDQKNDSFFSALAEHLNNCAYVSSSSMFGDKCGYSAIVFHAKLTADLKPVDKNDFHQFVANILRDLFDKKLVTREMLNNTDKIEFDVNSFLSLTPTP